MQVSEVTLLNTSLGESLTFSHASNTHVLEYCDLSNIPSELSTQKRVASDGLLVTSTRLEPRTISLVLWLVGDDDTELSAYRRSLSRIINPKQVVRILQNGYAIDGYPLHTPAVGTDRKVINDRMCRVYLEIYCPFPLFTIETPMTSAIASWEKKLIFPLNFEDGQIIFGLRSSSLIASMTNSGDVPCGAKFSVAVSGQVVRPKITNITTQEHIEINTTLENGDLLLIDTTGEIPKVTINGENQVARMTEDSSHMQLPVGSSDISYSALQGSEAMNVQIEISPLFLEVL